jgi:type IV secretory pathway TrbF-like protein
MNFRRVLLLTFVVLGCMLITLIWVANMTEQGAAAARPIVVTAANAGGRLAVTPSATPTPTSEPAITPSPFPTLSDILEDQ